MQTVSEVLNKLLVVGITDLDPDVRYAVLDSFDEQFDPHLAQAENLSALFISLQVIWTPRLIREIVRRLMSLPR